MEKNDISIQKRLKDMIIHPNHYSKEDYQNAYVLLLLYNNPTAILGEESNYSTYDYRKIPYYNNLIINNDFVTLIDESLDDYLFMDKLSITLLEKITSLLADSCKLIKLIKHPRTYAFKKFLGFTKKDDNIINYINNTNKVRSFDAEYCGYVGTKVMDKMKRLYDGTKRKETDKKEILALIERDKYVETVYDDDCLEMYSGAGNKLGKNKKYFLAVVLENKFVDMVNNIMDEFTYIDAYENAINIIDLSIRIKMHDLIEEELFMADYFTQEEINDFNLKKAEEVIRKLAIKLARKDHFNIAFHNLKVIRRKES